MGILFLRIASLPAPVRYIYGRDSVAFSPLVKIKVLPVWKTVIPHHDIPIGATQLRVHRKGLVCIFTLGEN